MRSGTTYRRDAHLRPVEWLNFFLADVVSILVIADLTRGTGRFNLAAGALAAMVGLGAALSTTVGGQLIQHVSYAGSFLGLAAIALLAVTLLAVGVPETLRK